MKLEEGMYVRTKNGMVAKIVSKEDVSGSLHRKEIVFILDNGNKLALNSKKVIKTSENIIDLIMVGDYVNGLLVTRICVDEETEKKYLNMYGSLSEWENEDIKSVVTKELFDSVKYEVE